MDIIKLALEQRFGNKKEFVAGVLQESKRPAANKDAEKPKEKEGDAAQPDNQQSKATASGT